MFSKFDIKKFTLWVFIIMVLSFVIAGSIISVKGVNNTFFSGSNSSVHKDINEEKSFAVDGLKDIDVNTVSTAIKIIPTDSNEVKVHFYGDASGSSDSFPQLITNQSGGRLHIQVSQKFGINFGINFHSDNVKLDIYVPKNYSENLTLGTVSGSGSIDNFSLNRLQFSTTSGELNASSLNTKATSFSSVSGAMKAAGFTGDLTFHSTSGELDVEYANFSNSIHASTVSGGSKIRLPEKSEFNITFNSTSGSIESDFPFTVKGSSDNRHNFSGSVGSSSNTIEVNSVSGGLKIAK